MVTARITSKNQLTLPEAVRKELGVGPGDELEFDHDKRGVFTVRRRTGNPFSRWRGHSKHLKGMRTDDLIEEMRGR